MKYLRLLICISFFINLNSHAKELGGNFILENFDSNKYELYKSDRVKLIFLVLQTVQTYALLHL